MGAAAVGSLASHNATSKKPVSLKFSIDSPFRANYKIHREWRAYPKGTANGNQNHDIEVSVVGKPSGWDHPPGSDVELSFTAFTGVDLDGQETRHLREIAQTIVTERLDRRLSELGSAQPWKMKNFNPAGWAGMMAMKAAGLYEIGFLNLWFPSHPVKVGDRWTSPELVGDEGTYGNQVKNLKGNVATCTYRLRAVDARRNTAVVSFDARAEMTYDIVDHVLKWNFKGTRRETQSGVWVIDIKTGLPISFRADRTMVESDGRSPEKEVTRTVVTRI